MTSEIIAVSLFGFQFGIQVSLLVLALLIILNMIFGGLLGCCYAVINSKFICYSVAFCHVFSLLVITCGMIKPCAMNFKPIVGTVEMVFSLKFALTVFTLILLLLH